MQTDQTSGSFHDIWRAVTGCQSVASGLAGATLAYINSPHTEIIPPLRSLGARQADADGSNRASASFPDSLADTCDDANMPQLNAIGVIVSDLMRAAAFYRRLGLEFPEDSEFEGQGHVEASLSSGLRIMLDTEETIRSFDPDWTRPSGGHRVALAFLCDSPEEVDRVYDELIAAGAGSHTEPWDAFWNQRYAQVADPDGNILDLFAPLDS